MTPKNWSCLTISDPRKGQARHFCIDGTVSNIESNLVIIECDDYSVYTDASRVADMISSAMSAWSATSFVLSINPGPRCVPRLSSLPESWTVKWTSKETLTLVVQDFKSEELESFFDEFAEREKWTIALPSTSHGYGSVGGIGPAGFEGAIVECVRWNFVFEVDLDGMIMGFMHAGPQFDEFQRTLMHR